MFIIQYSLCNPASHQSGTPRSPVFLANIISNKGRFALAATWQLAKKNKFAHSGNGGFRGCGGLHGVQTRAAKKLNFPLALELRNGGRA